MILRKPYKFLIKNFRLIHLVLAIISGYLLIKTNDILSFFNNYLNTTETIVPSGTSNEYFSGFMSLLVFIMLLGNIVIFIIMKMKNKPVIFYIINIIAYLIVGIIFIYDNSLIEKLEINALDIRTIKFADDFTLICVMLQTLSTVILTIRAIGFNLKKFDFEQDLKLEISEEDNEEFEFDVNIDKNKLKRNFKRKIRNIKYAYHENKVFSNIIICVVLVIILVFIYLNFWVFNRVYRMNQKINTTEFSYSLQDSFLVNKDYRGNKITNNYLVVTKLKIKNNTNKEKILDTAFIQLHIGKTVYNPITTYKDKILDLGENYNKQKINNEYSEYLITFEIPKTYKNKKMYFVYSDTNSKNYKVKLKNKKFDKKEKTTKVKLNEYIRIDDVVLNNIKFKISNYDIDNKIKAPYNFCETKDKCYQSYEYIYPTLTDNYEKVILKIESDIDLDKKENYNNYDLSGLIEMHGTIRYVVDLEEKTMKTKIKEVTPIKSNEENIYYFEVYSDIKDATQISLILTIRNKEYEYVLK